jgi:hypothetical protein
VILSEAKDLSTAQHQRRRIRCAHRDPSLRSG